mgnify:CR=1 FL=1
MGGNIRILYGLSFIAAFFASMQMGLINMLLNDAIDYVMLKDYVSLNGTLSSVKGFCFKLGGAIGNTMILQVLALTGYVAGKIDGQAQLTLVGINSMRFLTPTLCAILIVICLTKYPVEKHYKEIEEMKIALEM